MVNKKTKSKQIKTKNPKKKSQKRKHIYQPIKKTITKNYDSFGNLRQPSFIKGYAKSKPSEEQLAGPAEEQSSRRTIVVHRR